MVQNTGSDHASKGSSALDREADRVDAMMNKNKGSEAPQQAGTAAGDAAPSTQVEQNNRVDKARADAKAAGGGPDKPEAGLNQDG